MDTFEMCRLAADKARWSFDQELGDLQLNLEKRLLPDALCGKHLPHWISPEVRLKLNHIRGFSYSHIFLFVEEFIIAQTCSAAVSYVHQNPDALSALLNFTDEEIKHQRMFSHTKNLIADGLGYRPAELPDKEKIAKAINEHSRFAVFMLTLVLEWLTQRHYVECFQEARGELDPGFVKIFRLHWMEEAQHARLDELELRAMAKKMSKEDLSSAINEFRHMLFEVRSLLEAQDKLDVDSLETMLEKPFSESQRTELLGALHREFLWAFLLSGLEHKSFNAFYSEIIPEDLTTADELLKQLRTSGH